MYSEDSPLQDNGSWSHVAQTITCQSKTYRQIKRKDGSTSMKMELNDLQCMSDSKADEDSSYALVVRRYLGEEDKPESATIRINSPLLLTAFKEVVQSYPTVAADFMTAFELKSPFQILLHYWDQLDTYRQETGSPQMRQHLNLLFQFMKLEMGPEKEACDSMLRKHMITYKQAWVVYPPGELLYTEVLGQPWLLRAEKVAYETSRNEGPFMVVYAKYCDADDSKTGEAYTSFRIQQRQYFASDHPVKIQTLPVHPLWVLDQKEDLKEKLTCRGKRSMKNQGIVTRDYDGLAEYLKEPSDDYYHPNMADFEAIWLPFTETGRIILDRKTFEEENSNSATAIHQVEDPELFLMPPFLMGYSLDRKDWCRYLVDNIKDVIWKSDAWSSLMLQPEQKSILEALVLSHEYPSNARNQPEQKGRGLVVLLHGSPGSGKTMSAEAAAEMSHKALLTTSMSDLSKTDSPWRFERNLQTLLQFATTWKAIVLFDEADVLLQSREMDSINTTRMALVAVFLKYLEYFSGIVFLTTNRIESIDEAMFSRLHLSINFGPPDSETRRRIWGLNFMKVPADETKMREDAARDEAIDELARYKLNGRDISNVMNTARTLARFEGAQLDMSHIKKVLEVSQTFEKHVRETATKRPSVSE
ncbi:hypothetical protein FLAG1_10621 [Fusarium langsethiae]|uniref:AAA+ ATPase domain-containing protein n=1 Tax=Fusarium langsethiae TaxID=179993 RepID=A0A0M9ENE2_FUSLA|nr:hypothetical protein FLAG1_10621 [Fusarium langsethiae]GKU07137.1 unnamed protein product [Fusarium langsethiae]GKU22405.1 unnamed protein product [Fusarium langsethiae]